VFGVYNTCLASCFLFPASSRLCLRLCLWNSPFCCARVGQSNSDISDHSPRFVSIPAPDLPHVSLAQPSNHSALSGATSKTSVPTDPPRQYAVPRAFDGTENGDIIVHHYFLPNGVTWDARPRVMSLYSRIDVNADREYLIKGEIRWTEKGKIKIRL
jgi:hypothetical protein